MEDKEGAHHNFSKSPYSNMPGHWLLASMGKKVLRPGGLELTHWMVDGLSITPHKDIVELAPGVGRTAQITLAKQPHSYIGIERNENAAQMTRRHIHHKNYQVQIGDVQDTKLPDSSADVVYGEAFLTMQSQALKEKILSEVVRILKPEGLYGFHELCFDTDSAELVQQGQQELSQNIRVNARPLSITEWKSLLDQSGLEIVKMQLLPMSLLELPRLIKDEGPLGLLQISTRLLLHPTALKRILNMRKNFRKHSKTLKAIGIIAKKKS